MINRSSPYKILFIRHRTIPDSGPDDCTQALSFRRGLGGERVFAAPKAQGVAHQQKNIEKAIKLASLYRAEWHPSWQYLAYNL